MPSVSDTILTTQITFPVGEITNSSETNYTSSGLVVCNTTSVDNDVLDWSWQLTIDLDRAHQDQLSFLPSLPSHPTTVIDDEGIYFSSLASMHAVSQQTMLF